MRRISSLSICLLLASLLLAACGGPVKRVWPPQASLQELVIRDDGQWRLKLRLQNFSTVAMRYDEVSLDIRIDGAEAGRLSLQPRITVGPNSAELIEATLHPDAHAAHAAQATLGSGQGLRYRLDGRIVSGDPRGDYDFEFESTLHRVPGLASVLR